MIVLFLWVSARSVVISAGFNRCFFLGPQIMLEAILKLIEDNWQVVIVDGDSEIIWSEPITLSEAQKEADRYNARTTLVQDGLRRLANLYTRSLPLTAIRTVIVCPSHSSKGEAFTSVGADACL